MGTTLKELQEQNSNYRLAAEDKERIISDLQEQLTNSKSQTKELEERLERNQTFFKGFHRKLSDILEEQMPSSPVITMKPIYKGEGISEQISESVIQ
jgi:chromosome segregation ATPase